MKKLLLSLGALAAVVAPVATVVACGSTTPDKTPPKATTTWEEQKAIEVLGLTNRLAKATNPYEKQGIKARIELLKNVKTEGQYKALASNTGEKAKTGIEEDIANAIESLKDFTFHAPDEQKAEEAKLKAAKSEGDINAVFREIATMGLVPKDYAADKNKMLGIWKKRLSSIDKNSKEYKLMQPFFKSLVAAHDKSSVDEILSHFTEFGSPKN